VQSGPSGSSHWQPSGQREKKDHSGEREKGGFRRVGKGEGLKMPTFTVKYNIDDAFCGMSKGSVKR